MSIDRVRARGLRAAVTVIVLSACASAPGPAARPPSVTPSAPVAAVDYLSISDVIATVQRDFYQPVDEGDLVRRCTDRLVPLLPETRRAGVARATSAQALMVALGESTPAAGEAKELVQARNDACIAAMVSGLNPRDIYMSAPELARLLGTSTAGLGLEIGAVAAGALIVDVFEASPAALGGLQPGDVITHIGGDAVAGVGLQSVTDKLRGPVLSAVELRVLKGGQGMPQTFTLKRAEVRRPGAKAMLIEAAGVAHVEIASIEENTGVTLVTKLKQLAAQRGAPLNGVVLDLRRSPGGVLTSVIASAAVFLPRDTPILYTVGRAPDANRTFTATAPDYQRLGPDILANRPADFLTVPVVVLVSSKTASGAEIIAGALQAHKRARVAGTKTAGVGTIQTIFPLRGRAGMKISTAEALTPDRRQIEGRGLAPDVEVEVGSAGRVTLGDVANDRALAKAVELLNRPGG